METWSDLEEQTMVDRTRIEQAQAEREARDSVVHRGAGPGSADPYQALTRYLAAEGHHERRAEAESADDEDDDHGD